MCSPSRHSVELIERIVRDTLKPPENLTVAEWADKYRVLSQVPRNLYTRRRKK